MTLEEAITHCQERAEQCDICGAEHRQLALWLKELKTLRKYTSLEKVKEETILRESLRFNRLLCAMLKFMWANSNAISEEDRFPKLSEKWKARADKYRKEVNAIKYPEEKSVDTAWLAQLLINEYDDGLKEAVDAAVQETEEYIKNNPEE